MAVPIIMPRQGNTVETCIITKWHKKKGDTVKAGDILFTYETDKASFDEESKTEGILLDIFFQEDDEVPVLVNVCVIGEKGESTDEYRPGSVKDAPGIQEVPPALEAVPDEVTEKPETATGDRLIISPRARHLAAKERVDPSSAVPSGPHGRIIEKDIAKLAADGKKATYAASGDFAGSRTVAAGTGIGGSITVQDLKSVSAANTPVLTYEDVKLSNIRRITAKAMHDSLASSAQLTLNTTYDATEVLNMRKQFKEASENSRLKIITINDIMLFAVARVLLKHRDLNAHFLGDSIRYFNNVHLGIAVDTPRGLLVPTLFNSDQLDMPSLAEASKKLISKAQSASLSPDDLRGGTFTVTNLGILGIESFTPVINPPQTGILGVNNITYRQKKTDKGFETYPAMGLSLTFDHRALDGAPAARFLNDLVKTLENAVLLLFEQVPEVK